MALCTPSLVPQPGDRRPTRWTKGLGPIERFGLAVHAKSAPKPWLDSITIEAPVPVVALDDGVGLVMRPDTPVEVAGEGKAWVVEPAS